jgi:hypothetical protein
MTNYGDNISEVSQHLNAEVGVNPGARFWAYISPQNHTEAVVTKWAVTVQQVDGNWQGTITSDEPQQILKTPDLSGVFNVIVMASGPNMPWQKLTPQPDSKAQIGCNSNCTAMVGIIARPGGTGANYWTVWDALCNS